MEGILSPVSVFCGFSIGKAAGESDALKGRQKIPANCGAQVMFRPRARAMLDPDLVSHRQQKHPEVDRHPLEGTNDG